MSFFFLELLARFELATSSLPILFCLLLLVAAYRKKKAKNRCAATGFLVCLSCLVVACCLPVLAVFSCVLQFCCSFSGVLDRLAEDITGPLYALLVCMGVHPQRHRLVTVAKLFRYTGNVCAVCDRYTGEAVAELVRVQTFDPIAPGEALQIPARTLGVHRL